MKRKVHMNHLLFSEIAIFDKETKYRYFAKIAWKWPNQGIFRQLYMTVSSLIKKLYTNDIAEP